MAKERSDARLSAINRRQMLGTGVGLMGGAVTGIVGVAFAQEKPAPARAAAKGPGAVTSPNLSPPVVAVKGGRLRGLREGKTYSFLGIRYAEAERFGQPKPVQPWEAVRNAQAWGPCCPIPVQSAVGSDELVFPHRFWIAERKLPVSERLDAEPQPRRQETRHGLDARRRIHERLCRWKRMRTTAEASASSATWWWSASITG